MRRLQRAQAAPRKSRGKNCRLLHRRLHGLPLLEARAAIEKIRAHLTAPAKNRRSRAISEIAERIEFLLDVGLGYLTLDRSASTLSGGEAQRIRLATQIGSRLRGVLYVLDEPSIGLHARDNGRLLNTLETLRDLGNTVLVVEHDEETIRRADHVVDLGPVREAQADTWSPPARPRKSPQIPRHSPGNIFPAARSIVDSGRTPQPQRKMPSRFSARTATT